ncbi:hypothetical protein NDN08_002787 [Rhodosorus marinus]|uniref:BUB1 N-terminal domain-containing protein n=1 Tax=Rhodosorus marinus TaxID=101924 RepID=A0AAV8UW65_9RHOD|nr:hypothetical protein NDN08_002787 [Rhodosorus marinus]
MAEPAHINVKESPRWETSKENVRPRAQGRDPKLLEAALKANPLNKPELPELPVPDDSQDPLQLYYDFVLRVEQSLPGGCKELVVLLEAVTKKLVVHEEYKNSEKNVRLWLSYADLIPDPKIAYEYMKTNEIGTENPFFYEAWALVMEERGALKKANELLSIGCARFEGNTRLESLREGFDIRATESLAQSLAAHDDRERSSRERVNRPSSVQPSGTGKRTPGFTVFTDEPGFDAASTEVTRPTFRTIPTQKSSIKENREKPAKWSDRTMPQTQSYRATSSTPRSSSIAIYTDDHQVHQVSSTKEKESPRRLLSEIKRSSRFLR